MAIFIWENQCVSDYYKFCTLSSTHQGNTNRSRQPYNRPNLKFCLPWATCKTPWCVEIRSFNTLPLWTPFSLSLQAPKNRPRTSHLQSERIRPSTFSLTIGLPSDKPNSVPPLKWSPYLIDPKRMCGCNCDWSPTPYFEHQIFARTLTLVSFAHNERALPLHGNRWFWARCQVIHFSHSKCRYVAVNNERSIISLSL